MKKVFALSLGILWFCLWTGGSVLGMSMVNLEISVDGEVAFVSPTISVRDMGLSPAEQETELAEMWSKAVRSPVFPSEGFILGHAPLNPRSLTLRGKVNVGCDGISVSLNEIKLDRVRPGSADWRIDGILAKSLIETHKRPTANEPATESKLGSQGTSANHELDNRQVLADTFRELVRQALRKTKRDANKFGIDQQRFSVIAMGRSLLAVPNVKAVGVRGAPTIESFLVKARQAPVTFAFYWKAPGAEELSQAAFSLSSKRNWQLEVMLLWLGLPEKVPINPRLGEINGIKPLKEAIFQGLKVLPDGQIVGFKPPE